MTAYILVPLDGSALAESALPLHVKLARLTSSGIHLLRAVPPAVAGASRLGANPDDGPPESLEEDLSTARDVARHYLKDVSERLREDGLMVRFDVVEDAPATAIVECADRNPDVWLVAMPTHRVGPSGSWASGSVAQRVLHAARKPVLLTRPTKESTDEQIHGEAGFKRIIVPLDGSRFAEDALEQARHLALLTGATLALVCAIPPADSHLAEQLSADVAREYESARLVRYLTSTAAELRAEGLKVSTELVYGHPAEMILLAAHRLHGDLIVVAARGRRDLERLWLGSVAQKLVQASTLPVLLMRTPGLHAMPTAMDMDRQLSIAQ